MTTRSIAERFQSASETDLDAVVPLLDPDVVWVLNGAVQTRSADAFVARQRADLATGDASTVVEAVVADDARAVVLGTTTFTPKEGGDPMVVALTETLTIADGLVTRIVDVMAPVPS